MRFGLHSSQHQVSYPQLRVLWRHAAEIGFDACYLFDHFMPLHSEVESFLPEEAPSPEGSCLEAFATLAALAREVPEVGAGLMVAGVGYRPPRMLVHQTAVAAQAAPGRLEIGIGAGWFEREYRAYGYAFAQPGERTRALEKALEAVRGRFDGYPQAPRIWVAGTGRKRILPLAARLADSWNAMYLTPDEFRACCEVLDKLCVTAARPPSSLERSIALRVFCDRDAGRAHRALETVASLRGRDAARFRERSLAGSPEDCAARLREYAGAGATHVAVMVHPPYDLEEIALLASMFGRLR